MIIPSIKFRRPDNATAFWDDEIYMSAMNCTSVLTMDNESETALPNLRPRATSTGMKILIVDDNPDTLRLLEFLMSADGYSVRTAVGAEDALTHLYAFTPDAVLMDIRLPGMNGLELTRLIKLARGSKQFPIVAVSATDTAEMIQEAYEAA